MFVSSLSFSLVAAFLYSFLRSLLLENRFINLLATICVKHVTKATTDKILKEAILPKFLNMLPPMRLPTGDPKI